MLTNADGKAVLQVREEDCVGCNLCSIVCPADGAIDMIALDSGAAPMTWNQRQQVISTLNSSYSEAEVV
ncbi:dihydropyrimidine dehydrogenase subunit B [compost metagenome]